MRFRHDPTSGALYFRLREGEIEETLELHSPGAYMDVDKAGNVMGLEFLSLPEFLYFIDSMEGEVALPDRIEVDAFLEPNKREAQLSDAGFQEWLESYWHQYLDRDRTMWRSE